MNASSVSPERWVMTDEMEPGPGMVQTAVDGQHLDEIVWSLVG